MLLTTIANIMHVYVLNSRSTTKINDFHNKFLKTLRPHNVQRQTNYPWYLHPNIDVLMTTDKCFKAETSNHVNFLAWMKPERSLDGLLGVNLNWQLNSGQPTQIWNLATNIQLHLVNIDSCISSMTIHRLGKKVKR